MACVNEVSHCFTCHLHGYLLVEWAVPAFTPSRRASPPFARYSFLRSCWG